MNIVQNEKKQKKHAFTCIFVQQNIHLFRIRNQTTTTKRSIMNPEKTPQELRTEIESIVEQLETGFDIYHRLLTAQKNLFSAAALAN